MEEFRQKIKFLHEKDDWRSVLEVLNEEVKWYSYVLWIRPSAENLHFIAEAISEMGLQGLVSIGCGTGLLEWLLTTATGLKVIGLERDRRYWSSKPNFKPFLEHLYPEDSNFVECCTSEKYALAFCYFNYREAFDEYIDNYKGTCVIIIGPGEGRGTHTDPEPFNPKFRSELWQLKESQEICGTKDYIAVYARPSCLEENETAVQCLVKESSLQL